MFELIQHFRNILYYTFEWPLRQLYLRGPAVLGYGFWEGMELTEICCRLTGVPSGHWDLNMAACDAVIDRKLDAINVFVLFSAYITVLYHGTKMLVKKIKSYY